jgi:hypothetical protein
MNDAANRWYRVPEVWLMIVLLGGTVIGSLALVRTAYTHPDATVGAEHPVASPLPPSRHAAVAKP